MATSQGHFVQSEKNGEATMTEAEWLASEDPDEMARFAMRYQGNNRRKAGRRKLLLFGCACCRYFWDKMLDPRSRQVVEVAERLADGKADREEVKIALSVAEAAYDDCRDRLRNDPADHANVERTRGWLKDDELRAAHAAWCVLSIDRRAGSFAGAALCYTQDPYIEEYPISLARCRRMANGLRCIFGNPFKPALMKSTWKTNNCKGLAAAIYDERAFGRLPILADALEDAGCDNADILDHCRQPGEHVRGCWVVDLVLAKK
jgi:hypothetical protein